MGDIMREKSLLTELSLCQKSYIQVYADAMTNKDYDSVALPLL